MAYDCAIPSMIMQSPHERRLGGRLQLVWIIGAASEVDENCCRGPTAPCCETGMASRLRCNGLDCRNCTNATVTSNAIIAGSWN
jgi:hypothetical protein